MSRLDPEYKRRREAEMNDQLRQMNREADGCRARRELAHDQLPTLPRGQRAPADEEDPDDASIGRVALATETPIRRVNFWGDVWEEILDMGGMRTERLPQLPMLAEHTRSQLAGVWREARADRDRVLRAVPQFSRNQFGQEVKRDVLDGVRSTTSIGYRIWAAQLESVDGDGIERWRMIDWEPLEASWEVIPADLNAAVGRSTDTQPVAVATRSSMMALDNPTVDVDNAREEAREAETTRVRTLTRLGRMHDRRTEEVDQWIRDGVSVEQVSRTILDDARSQPRRPTTPAVDAGDAIGLSQRERDRFSIRAAIMQTLGERHPGEGEPAGFEMEVSRALESQLPKDYKRHGGILVPSGLAYPHARRSVDQTVRDRMTPGYATRQTGLDTLTQGAGAEVVFEEFGGFAPLLRNRTLVIQFGARYLPGLVGDVGIVKQTAAAVAEWVEENPNNDVSDTELELALVQLKSKTLMGSTFFTRQLLRQSAATVPIDMLVEDDLLAVHARAVDLAALHGAGTATEPQGIYGATGVNSVAINGNPTYAQLVSMITPIAEANGDVARLAYMTTPRVATKLMVTEIFPGTPSGSPVWSGTVADGRVAGYRAGATNQVRSDLAADGTGATPTPLTHHGLILGDWPGMTIGEWGMVELIADPFTRKKRGIIEVTSFQMVDIELVRPEVFTVGTGVLIS